MSESSPKPPAWLSGKGPGDPLYDAWLRNEMAKADAPSTNTRPTVDQLPANGLWTGPANQPGSNYKVAQADGTYQVHTVQKDGSIQTASTSVGPRAGGSGGSSYTPSDPNRFNDAKAQRQLAGGATPDLPAGSRQVDATRAISPSGATVLTLDPETRLWVNAGFPPNAQDRAAGIAGARGGIMPGAAAAAPGVLLPQGTSVPPGQPGAERASLAFNAPDPAGRQYAGLSGFQGPGGALTPAQSPQLPSFAAATQPGYGVPVAGRGSMNSGNDLNMLIAQGRWAQQSGPVVQPNASRPNNAYEIVFRNQGFYDPSRGTVAADRAIPGVNFSVPLGYQRGSSGYTLPNGAFAPYDIPINVTAPGMGANGVANPGGAGLIQMAGPNNAWVRNADGGSTGWVTRGSGSNDIGLTYGRSLSNDSATRAVQTAQLMDARDQLTALGYSPQAALAAMTAASPSSWQADDEEDGGGGPRPYAKGGSVASRPLGNAATDGQVVSEPVIGYGTITGKAHFILGEDNADADSLPNPERIKITPIRGYATGGTVTTGLPPPPKVDTIPVIDSGPEVGSALTSAKIAQQQQGQQMLRARAGLGGTIGIRTNAKMEGLAPGYYTTPADYSEQVGGLQTKLAGLGPVSSNPQELLAYKNMLSQMQSPLQEAQGIETKLLGLGNVGDAATIQSQINQYQQQLEPLQTAQGIYQKLTGLGQVQDMNALNTTISGLNQQLGPLKTIIDAQESLTGLGGYKPTDMQGDIQTYQGYIDDYEKTGVWHPGVDQAVQNLPVWRAQLSSNIAHNQRIDQTRETLNNLLAASGLTLAQVNAQTGGIMTQLDAAKGGLQSALQAQQLQSQLAQYVPQGTDVGALVGSLSSQIDAARQAYDAAQQAAGYRTQLANYVPPGTNVSQRLGEIGGAMDTASRQYDNSLSALDYQRQIQSYRNNTEIQGFDENAAPPTVIQQAVVTTPALKAIAQSDPESATSLARIDYALSNNAWTPATSNLLVALSSIKGNDSVQSMLQSLIARIRDSRAVPAALGQAAQSGNVAAMAAAAKFAPAA